MTVAMDLFKRQGFDQTTVDQIASEADVARGTVFNHFPVKEAIIGEYLQRALRQVEPQAASFYGRLPETAARLTTAFRLVAEWMDANLSRNLNERYLIYRMQTAVQTVQDPAGRTGFARILTHIIRLGQEEGEIRRDISAEELADRLEWAWVSAVMVRLAQPERFTVAMTVERIVDLFLNGTRVGGRKDNVEQK